MTTLGISLKDVRSKFYVVVDNDTAQAFDRRQLLAVPALLSAALFLQRPAWGATTGTYCYTLISVVNTIAIAFLS